MSDRVVMITGGGGGIGTAMARAFAGEGDRVVVCDVDLAAAERAARLSGARVHRLDVAEEGQVAAVVDQILAEEGRVDVLCNNAGVGCWSDLVDTSAQAWDRTMAVNIRGMFLCARAVAPAMIEAGGGAILNTASVHSFGSWPGCSVYAASKGAVLAFTRSIALELLPHGIRVNAIAPGTTDTAMFRFDEQGAPIPEAELAAELANTPIRRAADPDEIARAAVFLASPGASFVVGACLAVDGGLTVRL
jgi:NAD(P)-dependent dehydrogenase (short-subunit alcohol dehydrogenase family)